MSEITKLPAMSSFLQQPNVQKMLDDVLKERKAQFVVEMTTLASSSEQLLRCDRKSLIAAGLFATSMGLSMNPNLGQAWAVPYRRKDGSYAAQFQMGVRGYTALAQRSGLYLRINDREVRAGEYVCDDEFGDPIIQWKPVDEREKLPIVGYFAGFELVNGFKKKAYWSTARIETHAGRHAPGYRYYKEKGASTSTARSGNKESPWASDFDAMARKTVLKNTLKNYGPLSVELQDAIKYDQAVGSVNMDTGEITADYVDAKDVTQELATKEQRESLVRDYPQAEVIDILKQMKIDLNKMTVDEYEIVIASLQGDEVEASDESADDLPECLA